MAVIPEVLLQRVIVRGYRALREDPRLLDSLFKNMTQQQQAAIKEYILETKPHFAINYPRDDVKVPSLILILKNESENVPFMGDSMQTVLGPQEHLVDTLPGHAGSTSGPGGLTTKVAENLEVVDSDDRTVQFADSVDLSDLLENPPGCLLATVIAGTGAGEVYQVTRISEDALDISGTFDPYLDSTSRIDLRLMNDMRQPTLGEPSRVFDAGNARNLQVRGAQYEVTYHLHVIASGPEEVIYLYSVIKALLISQRALLEGQGIMALRISGSDFAPKTDHLPSEIFQRMMVLTFTYPFAFVEEVERPSSFILNISPDDPVTGDQCETLFGITIEL